MDREITLREYGRVIWSGRWIIVVAAVATALVGMLFSLTSTTTHTANAEVVLGVATTTNGTPLSTAFTNPGTAATVLLSDALITNAAEQLGVETGVVRSAVTLRAPRVAGGAAGNQPTLITVTWTGDDADLAVRGVNTYAQTIENFMLEQSQAVFDTYNETVTRANGDVQRLKTEVERYRTALRQALARGEAATSDTILVQTLLGSAQGQLSNAQALLASQEIALRKAEQVELPRIISEATDATSSGGVRGVARTVIVAGAVGALLGIIITFIWKGSPAGRARREEEIA